MILLIRQVQQEENPAFINKLLHPPVNIENLKLQQNAIRFFTQYSNELVLPFSNRQMKSLDMYLSSNIQKVESDKLLDSIKFCLKDKQAFLELKSSLKEVINFTFLTGPNMAGKTTFLKSTGIAVYMAHLGMGIPAKSARMSYFDRLLTSLNIPDNVLKGYSYFFSEGKRVKQLAESLKNGENVSSLFDELFKGTNLKDAYDASVLIISGLIQWKSSIVILSSHLWEVWDKIEVFPNIRSFCFESEVINGTPVFTFRLMPGVSDMRLGMTIINNEKKWTY